MNSRFFCFVLFFFFKVVKRGTRREAQERAKSAKAIASTLDYDLGENN